MGSWDSADMQERTLLLAIRNGNREAREQLICSLIPSIQKFVFRWARAHYPEIDQEDLVSVGIVAMLERFEHALHGENPCAYLLTVAYGRIKDYCWGDGVIRIPHTAGASRCVIDSLDHPQYLDDQDDEDAKRNEVLVCSYQQTQRDYSALYRALHKLSPSGQEIICRMFGLCGYGEETITEIAGGACDSTPYNRIKTLKGYHLKRLREILAREGGEFEKGLTSK